MKFVIFFFYFYSIFTAYLYGSIKEKIIDNLYQINNLSFNFIQTIDGKDEKGNCIIKYPKKIYCVYTQNNRKELVSNGQTLVIKNEKNKQYYLYPIETTPLNIILDKKLMIDKFKKLEPVKVGEKYYNFELKDGTNIINIFFDHKDLNMTGWQTEDIFQNLSITFIYDLKINNDISEKIFILPRMF